MRWLEIGSAGRNCLAGASGRFIFMSHCGHVCKQEAFKETREVGRGRGREALRDLLGESGEGGSGWDAVHMTLLPVWPYIHIHQ